jgi:hypothetical protein
VSALTAIVLACSSANPATPVAPASAGPAAATDGSTLKASAPSVASPVNDQKLTSTTVVLTAGPSTPQFATGVPLQYRFQVMNAAGTVVDQALVATTSWTVVAQLAPNARHTWRVRAEYLGEVGPWSVTQSFITIDPAIINDPLTNGRTIGRQVGGGFVAGGWQSRSLTDGIDYDVPACAACTLEFDATNFGPQEGLPFERDLKWVSMGDANSFGSFADFRDNPWKMHLVQRADYPSGMEIVWRNGGTDADGGDPGDHRIKLTDTPITFSSSAVYHFLLDWDSRGYSIAVNGITVMQDGWGHLYTPPNFRVSLGCYPRGDSLVGAIYRNVLLKKKQ